MIKRKGLYDKILTKELLEQLYNKKGSLKGIARELEIDPGTVKRYMLKHGLSFKPKIRYTCNELFFSTDTERSFYWAGFIAADGSVSHKKMY